MLEKAKEATREGKYTHIEYARFADDGILLVDEHPKYDWLWKESEGDFLKNLIN